jgi:hypothetical protein
MTEHERQAIDVYVETGAKRTFAGALEWPGWCRAGRDESAACEALVAYAARYQAVLTAAGIDFPALPEPVGIRVVDRLAGTPTTDFGAPGEAPAADERAVTDSDLARLQAMLEACWAALDRARDAAQAELAKGPRGGGRDRDTIYTHVVEAEVAYLSRLGRNAPMAGPWNQDRVAVERAAALEGLEASAYGLVAAEGPRGGRRWSARYFVRRASWHALDHAWEIEDRSAPQP